MKMDQTTVIEVQKSENSAEPRSEVTVTLTEKRKSSL